MVILIAEFAILFKVLGNDRIKFINARVGSKDQMVRPGNLVDLFLIMPDLSDLSGDAICAQCHSMAPRALGRSAHADKVGTPLPTLELTGMANGPAESADDLFGRTVLVEFFAYW